MNPFDIKLNSYVVWYLDNHYGYAWGTSEEDALNRYLSNWAAGIKSIVSAEKYLNGLPPHLYIHSQANAVWEGNVTPVPHSNPYDPALNAKGFESPSIATLSQKLEYAESRLAIQYNITQQLAEEIVALKQLNQAKNDKDLV